MFRKISVVAVAFVALLFPIQLMAGGPAWLSLPIDGVANDKVDRYEQLLAAKLKDKVIELEGKPRSVQLQQRSNQWNLMFYLEQDVSLRDIEVALEGSGLSIPRDRLHLFGHTILEIDADKTSSKALLAELEALNFVSVEKADAKENRLVVTVDMPYPTQYSRPDSEPIQSTTFQRNELASDPSTKSEGAATAKMLPTYQTFQNIAAKHNAKLKDMRWSVNFHCRPLGGVAVPAPDRTAQANRTTSNSSP